MNELELLNFIKRSLKFLLFYIIVLLLKYSLANNIISSLTNYFSHYSLNRAYNFTFVIISIPNLVFYFIVGLLVAKIFKSKLWLFPPIIIEAILFTYRLANTYFDKAHFFDYFLIIFPFLIILVAMYMGASLFLSRSGVNVGKNNGVKD